MERVTRRLVSLFVWSVIVVSAVYTVDCTASRSTKTVWAPASTTITTTSRNINHGSSTSNITVIEIEAMKHIRHSFLHSEKILWDWMVGEPPCEGFVGIVCSGGSVSSISITDKNLAGTLSPYLDNLTNLHYLILRNVGISGSIPSEIWRLQKLVTLDLSHNFLVGQVPSNLSYLPNLRSLDLSDNNLTGPIPKILPNPRTHIAPTGPPSNQVSLPSGDNSVKTALAVVCLVILCVIALSAPYLRNMQGHNQEPSMDLGDNFVEMQDLGDVNQFTLGELKVATNNFGMTSFVANGYYATVFKGLLEDGTVVAIKKLNDINNIRGMDAFRREVELINHAKHQHILPLLGICVTTTERFLIYPYMSNGSLASRLAAKPALDWGTRKRIALGVAEGLHYLHDMCNPRIIHRDVKPDNILLNDELKAVVADFGLIKPLTHEESHPSTSSVRGTPGYIAPEYFSSSVATEKGDVYAFGIVLLELICGTRFWEFSNQPMKPRDRQSTVELVKTCFREKNFGELLDPNLKPTYDQQELEKIADLALSCIEKLPTSRPKMVDIVEVLSEMIH